MTTPLIPFGDYMYSATQVAVSSGNHSIISQVALTEKPFLRSISVSNLHGSAEALVRVMSGAIRLCHLEVPAKSTVTRYFDGQPGQAGAGIEFAIVSNAHMMVDAEAFKRLA